MSSRTLKLTMALAVLSVLPLGAQERADTARSHLVRTGDTLWDLAGRYLGNPFRWPDIFEVNRQRVGNPHLILPSWLLRIPGVGPEAPATRSTAPVLRDASERTVFFAEATAEAHARMRFAESAEPVAVTQGEYHRAGLLVPEAAVAPVARLAEKVSPSVVPLEIPPQILPYDRVYLAMAPGRRAQLGDRLHLLRPGRQVGGFGRIFESTGLVRVVGTEAGVVMAEVEAMYGAVRVGDLAVPLPAFTPPVGRVPVPAERRLQGRILAFANPHPLQNLFDIAFVDLGAESGVVEGDELEVVLPPERRPWGLRPEILVARLRVVRTTPRTAAVKVIHLEHPALGAGLAVRLVTRMR